MDEQVDLRPATLEMLPALNTLITESITQLCAGHYTEPQLVAVAAQAASGRYNDLISKGTYLVVVTSTSSTIVASAGYTPNRTIYSPHAGCGSTLAADEPFNPRYDAVWIRGVYTSPSFIGRGLGRRVMSACEAAARRELGIAGAPMTFRLASTVNAVPFYRRCGYAMVEEEVVGVPRGETMRMVLMEKVCYPVGTEDG